MSLKSLVLAAIALLPFAARAGDAPKIITDPSAVVLGHSLNEWAALYFKWEFTRPACWPNATDCWNAENDPTGKFAEHFNHGPMFFATNAGANNQPFTCNSGPSSTINVPEGMPVLFQVATVWDTEGPDIVQTIPGFVPSQGSYAQEVETVVSASSWNLNIEFDCKPVTFKGITSEPTFSAGHVSNGDLGQVASTCSLPGCTGLPAGYKLFPTGERGYWMIVTNLSPGMHYLTNNGITFFSPYYCPTGCVSTPATFAINVVPAGP